VSAGHPKAQALRAGPPIPTASSSPPSGARSVGLNYCPQLVHTARAQEERCCGPPEPASDPVDSRAHGPRSRAAGSGRCRHRASRKPVAAVVQGFTRRDWRTDLAGRPLFLDWPVFRAWSISRLTSLETSARRWNRPALSFR
jgi:hypothetical protein